jgi:hypothetical protein
MADDVVLNAATTSGDTIAADEISGKKYQRVKLVTGDDGYSEGDVSAAHPLPVEATVTSLDPGTDEDSLGKRAHDPHNITDVGVMVLGVRRDSLASSLPYDNGDYAPIAVDQYGRVRIFDAEVTEDGSTAGTLLGKAILWKDTSDVMRIPSASYPLPVEIIAGGGGGGGGDASLAEQQTQTTHLAAIETAVEILDNAVSGNEFQVDVVTLPSIPAGTNNIGDVDVLSLPALPAGTNNIGDVDVLSIVPGTSATSLGKAEDSGHSSGDTGVFMLGTRQDSPLQTAGNNADYCALGVSSEGGLWVTPTPSNAGGCSIFRSIDLDESEEEVKASVGSVYGWFIFNAAASTRYVKFYNATAASVVVGTTAPVLTIPIPAGAGANIAMPHGLAFSTAITVAATTGVADNDTGAPGANEVIINLWYK